MENNWFLRLHKGLECWKNASLHPILRMNGRILTKLAQLYFYDMERDWLDFGGLAPIFKVTGGLIFLENGLSAPYLLNGWILTKRAQLYCWDRDKS